MKKEYIGWIPKGEPADETLSWFIEDPSLIMHKDRAAAEAQWGVDVKQIKITIEEDDVIEALAPAVASESKDKKPANVQSFGGPRRRRSFKKRCIPMNRVDKKPAL